MPEVGCVFFRHAVGWQMVGQNVPEKYLPNIDTITFLLNQPNEAKASLRRYLQREFKGEARLDFGAVNRRHWCMVRFKSAVAMSEENDFQMALHGLLERSKSPPIDLASVLNLFHLPVALVNCRTGRIVTSYAWRRGTDLIDSEEKQLLARAVKQLCQRTPLDTESAVLDEACGLMLMSQRVLSVSAWRLMVWYSGPEYSVEMCGDRPLTLAEKRVCQQLLAGSTVEGIASTFCKSVHTVRTQLRNAYRKLQVTNQRDLLLKLQVSPQVLNKR